VKTLLLTGASGFLGQQFSRFYKELGWRVLTLGRRESDDIFWDSNVKRAISATDVDVSIDRIVHCAAVNEVNGKVFSETIYDVNVTLTRSLCNLAIEAEVKEFIYISTFHVYGITSGLVTSTTPCNPQGDYALTHYLSEEILRSALSNTSISVLCLRPTNIYGIPENINAFNRWSLVPFDFVRSAVLDKKISLLTSGLQLRNFVDVINVISQTPAGVAFEVRNIFGNDTMSIKEFAELVIRVAGDDHGMKISLDQKNGKSSAIQNHEKLVFSDCEGQYKPIGSVSKFISEFSKIICEVES
jgi:UDP-glucose 4-epimerase